MKKLIISKTILFVFIILFIAGFTRAFGIENSLIGVSLVVAMLMYLERDLTANPWRNFIGLLSVNLLQGIFGYLAVMNLWLAIPLNFISMFIVGYFFTYNLKKPFFIAFGLQYLFILTVPVPASDLPLRLLALALGAVVIMATQFIVNKDKLAKAGNKYFISICEKLMEKLEHHSNAQDCQVVNKSIETDIKELRKVIYRRRSEGYYLSNEGRLKLKISSCFEKIYRLINRFEEVEHKDEVMTVFKLELQHVKQFIENRSVNSSSLHAFRELGAKLNSVYITEIVHSFELLYDLLEEVQATDKKELNKVDKIIDIPANFKSRHNHFVNFNRNSVRFTYAMRLGIVITIAAFLSAYFELEQGEWMLYTIFSVTQPYSEQAKFRFSQRIVGTFIGVAIFVVLFTIFTDITSRSIITLLFGYLNSYAVHYRNIVLTVTVAALGAASLVSDLNIMIIERVIFIIVGVIIGMVANRFLFPHSIYKGTATLVKMYKDTSKILMEEVYQYIDSKTSSHSINNLFAVTSFIEDRILLNNETLELKHSEQYLEKQRKLNHGIYELFLRIQRNKIEQETAKLILEDVDQMMKLGNEEFDQIMKQVEQSSTAVNNIDDYIVLKDTIEIFEKFKILSEYQVELEPRKHI